AVNFGIVYGISSYGLGQDLSISNKEAKQYIDQYFVTYPQIKKYLDKLISDAKEKGYSETYFGRRRPIPELKASNFMQKQFGERVAMNAPIQGTAADIMKIAMIKAAKMLKEAGLKSKIILQVHDELVLEAPIEEKEEASRILSEAMKGAADLAVSLEIGLETGNNWLEAH
ncbi:MAG: DNA polymerase I, partial [Lachnospiraceae bacterium]|nr:DNA polymerase I [Lachnospiraceae bacterium]